MAKNQGSSSASLHSSCNIEGQFIPSYLSIYIDTYIKDIYLTSKINIDGLFFDF